MTSLSTSQAPAEPASGTADAGFSCVVSEVMGFSPVLVVWVVVWVVVGIGVSSRWSSRCGGAGPVRCPRP